VSKIVEPDIKVDFVKEDPKDNKIIEAAIAGKAKFIVTGDTHHLLPLKKIENIKIVSVKEFLKTLKS
jgi:predicted nucleic acid-binding protein